jgi:hypothetical protein
MRAVSIVVTSPAFDEDLGFVQRIEEFPVQQFISQFAIKRFDIAVLPRAAGLNKQGLDTHALSPVPHRVGSEFGGVIRTNMRGDSAVDKELGQAGEHIVRPQTARNLNRQTLPSVLIDDG